MSDVEYDTLSSDVMKQIVRGHLAQAEQDHFQHMLNVEKAQTDSKATGTKPEIKEQVAQQLRQYQLNADQAYRHIQVMKKKLAELEKKFPEEEKEAKTPSTVAVSDEVPPRVGAMS